MVDAIYTYLIKTIYDRYYSKHRTDKVPDKLLIKFNEQYTNSRRYQVFQSGNSIYQVQIPDTGIKYIVNLSIQECDCTNFQEYGSPCAHAIAACRYEAIDPFDQFGPVLTMETYRQTYEHFAIPINIENLDSTAGIQPPEFKKQRGWPKVKRLRKGAWKRKATYCKNCNGTGHNKRSCRSAPALHGRAQRRRDLQEAYEYLEELEAENQSESEEERVTAHMEWLAQNCDSDSELSELNSNQFDDMETGSKVGGSEVGGSKVSSSEMGMEGVEATSPLRTTRSGANYGKRRL
jgi:hypothetical protein